jgi:hypothetical protein
MIVVDGCVSVQLQTCGVHMQLCDIVRHMTLSASGTKSPTLGRVPLHIHCCHLVAAVVIAVAAAAVYLALSLLSLLLWLLLLLPLLLLSLLLSLLLLLPPAGCS